MIAVDVGTCSRAPKLGRNCLGTYTCTRCMCFFCTASNLLACPPSSSRPSPLLPCLHTGAVAVGNGRLAVAIPSEDGVAILSSGPKAGLPRTPEWATVAVLPPPSPQDGMLQAAWAPSGVRLAVAFTSGTVSIHHLTWNEARTLTGTRSCASLQLDRKVRRLHWHPSHKAILGISDTQRLSFYDCSASGTPRIREMAVQGCIDDWAWADEGATVAILAGNLVRIQEWEGQEEEGHSTPAQKDSPLDVSPVIDKRTLLAPLGSGGNRWFAVVAEPCLQSQIAGREGITMVNETLRTLEMAKRKTGLLQMEDAGGSEEPSDSLGLASDNGVLDLRGKVGGGLPGKGLASASLLETLMGGMALTAVAPPPQVLAPAENEKPNRDAKLLLLKLAAHREQEQVVACVALDRKAVSVPGLLAASASFLAVADPWSSTLLAYRWSGDSLLLATDPQHLALPLGYLPRGLGVPDDKTLVCWAVRPANSRNDDLKEGNARLFVFALGQQAEEEATDEKRDVLSFLRAFRVEVRERFDALDAKLDRLEQNLAARV